MKTRTLQLVPMVNPAWAVFAIDDVPNAHGNIFWLESVVALALVEHRYPDDDPDCEVRPVCLVEGAFEILDHQHEGWTQQVIDALPTTDEARAYLNDAARRHITEKRERDEKARQRRAGPVALEA